MRLPRCWLGVCLLLAASAAGAQEPEPRPRVDPVDGLWQALRRRARGGGARRPAAGRRGAAARLRRPAAGAAAQRLARPRPRRGPCRRGLRGTGPPSSNATSAPCGPPCAGTTPTARKAALNAIGTLDPNLSGQGSEPLARAFTGDLAELTRSGPAPLRELAVRTLGRVSPEPAAAAAALGAVLKDPDPHLRAEAAEALVALVATALRQDPSRIGGDGGHEDVVRAACAVVPPAAGGLGDAGTDVRRRCAERWSAPPRRWPPWWPTRRRPRTWRTGRLTSTASRKSCAALRPLAVALGGQCGELARGRRPRRAGARPGPARLRERGRGCASACCGVRRVPWPPRKARRTRRRVGGRRPTCWKTRCCPGCSRRCLR